MECEKPLFFSVKLSSQLLPQWQFLFLSLLCLFFAASSRFWLPPLENCLHLEMFLWHFINKISAYLSLIEKKTNSTVFVHPSPSDSSHFLLHKCPNPVVPFNDRTVPAWLKILMGESLSWNSTPLWIAMAIKVVPFFVDFWTVIFSWSCPRIPSSSSG